LPRKGYRLLVSESDKRGITVQPSALKRSTLAQSLVC